MNKELITFTIRKDDLLHCSKTDRIGRIDGKTSCVKRDIENHYLEGTGWFPLYYDRSIEKTEYNVKYYIKASNKFLSLNHSTDFKLDII